MKPRRPRSPAPAPRRYRWRHEKLVERVATCKMPTKHGDFVAHCYPGPLDDDEQVARS